MTTPPPNGVDMRATELLALSHGMQCSGDLDCFYCGSKCDGAILASEYVKDTFNDRNSVAFADSIAICKGCVLALDEKVVMPGKDKPQKFRNYSWLFIGGVATPLTKADLAAIRSACLNPPPAPWALAIATSGQRHSEYYGDVTRRVGDT